MSEDLIDRLRLSVNRSYRDRREQKVTCPRVPQDHALHAERRCHEVIGGHVCKLSNPHPPGYVHECFCGKFGEELERG